MGAPPILLNASDHHAIKIRKEPAWAVVYPVGRSTWGGDIVANIELLCADCQRLPEAGRRSRGAHRLPQQTNAGARLFLGSVAHLAAISKMVGSGLAIG
jgi:hypothetical protein